jgi:hypothetical protein
VTKAMYGQHLEDNLQALHQKLHQRAYRPALSTCLSLRNEFGG